MVERPIDSAMGVDANGTQLRTALKRYIARRVPASDVDDLLQDVFCNLIKARTKSPIDNIRAYVFKIASNLVSARGRTTQWHDQFDEDIHRIEDHAIFPADQILISQEELQAVMDNIMTLPTRTRDVFILHRFEDMTYGDIARHLDISTSAVEKHMIKALRILSQAAEAR